MEYYNKILCVTHEELTSGDDPVIKPNTLYSNVRRGNIQCINRGGGEGNHALYVYSSLPAKYQRRFVARYGEPEEIMRREILRGRVRKDERAEDFFEKHRYDKNGELVPLPESTITAYTLNASVLNTLIGDIARLRPKRNSLGISGDYWEEVMKRSEELRTEFGHTLPGCVGRLKELIKRYSLDHYEVLISGKYGNRNTLKIGEEEGRYIIALKRSQMPKYTDHQIFETYNRTAPERGWKPLKSERGMKGWLNSPRIKPLWHDAVFGEMRTHQLYDRKHHTVAPCLPGFPLVWRRHETEPLLPGRKRKQTHDQRLRGGGCLQRSAVRLPHLRTGRLHRPIPRLPHGYPAQQAQTLRAGV